VLGAYDLNYYSKNMTELYHKLNSIKKTCFDPNDRIVFTLFDHDFYFNGQGPGWTLYNLQLILSELDISNFFCLLLTHQPEYDDYTRQVQQQLTDDDFPIRSITTLLNPDWLPEGKHSIAPQFSQIEKIEKAYCALSRQSRPYRTFFMSKLMNENLFDHGLIGYNNIPFHNKILTTEDQPKIKLSTLNDDIDYEFSFLEIPKHSQRLILKNKKNKIIYSSFRQQYTQYKNFHENIDLNNKAQSCELNNENPISRSFLYVGLETHCQLFKPHVSRISLRGIVERRPFVIFGCTGTLKFMQNHGFKTFNEFWDESYDCIDNVEDRVDNIINVIKKLSSLSLSDLKDLYCEMQPIIDYNHDFYHNEFAAQEKKHLQDSILKNLKGN
jgi:hypothetical protein